MALGLSPHVLDFDIRGRFLGASFPKPVHDRGIEPSFRPLRVRVDAPAASIYDDDDMLCSTLGKANTEIIEVTIR